MYTIVWTNSANGFRGTVKDREVVTVMPSLAPVRKPRTASSPVDVDGSDDGEADDLMDLEHELELIMEADSDGDEQVLEAAPPSQSTLFQHASTLLPERISRSCKPS